MKSSESDNKTVGYIHSIESMATLDGPGLRTVIFVQGCPLKCLYCHNVDSTLKVKRNKYTVKTLYEKIIKNKDYWGDNKNEITGGVTVSGGDPVYQPKFVNELFKVLKYDEVHTTIDTSLYTTKKIIDDFLPNIDLWMVSIKHFDNEYHQKLTGVPNQPILENLKYLDKKITEEQLDSKIRIRYVILPGVTDKKDQIDQLIELLKGIKNIESIELLPYSTLGKHKWIEIFGKYELEDIREGTKEDAQKLEQKILEKLDIKIIY